jgi:hypothetical protein
MTFLYRVLPPNLAFKCRFSHLGRAAGKFGRGLSRDKVMPQITHSRDLNDLADRLRNATETDALLTAEVIGSACRRLPSLGRNEKSARLEQLIRSGAWINVALVLIDLELPLWQVRRLTYDGGEWHCALSRERELPDWLDQSIESHHADMSLAILGALVEVKRASQPESRTSVPAVNHDKIDLYEPLCCDNSL